MVATIKVGKIAAATGTTVNIESGHTLHQPGQVIQVASGHSITSSSTTAQETDIVSVAITPKFATSKILIQGHVSTVSNVNHIMVRLYRDSTHIGYGTGSTMSGIISSELDNNNFGSNGNASFGAGGVSYLDSPATSSAITYKFTLYQPGPGSTLYINRSPSGYQGASSNITALEIAQ